MRYREIKVSDLLEDYKAHAVACSTCRQHSGGEPNGLCRGGARLWARWIKAKKEERL